MYRTAYLASRGDLAVAFKHMAAVTPRQRGRGWSSLSVRSAEQEVDFVNIVWVGSGTRIDARMESLHNVAGTWEAKVMIESDHVEGVQVRNRLESAPSTDRQRLARWLVKVVQRTFSTSPYLE